MRISITRTELTILATSLITLIALALAPAWWGAAFGQGVTLNSLAAQTRELQGIVSVTNEAGERLPGASLSLTSTFAPQTARSTVTNDQGEYKVTDLVTGESSINLPIEAVQSVEVLTNPYSAEYGQFTGAVTSVQTRSGSDKFHANATSFFPRFRRRGGSFVGIAAFTPRVTFSGPLIKDKLKFFQSFEYRYVRTPIENLPPLKRDTDLESFDSLSQLDSDIAETHHLTTTFPLFPHNLRYV